MLEVVWSIKTDCICKLEAVFFKVEKRPNSQVLRCFLESLALKRKVLFSPLGFFLTLRFYVFINCNCSEKKNQDHLFPLGFMREGVTV